MRRNIRFRIFLFVIIMIIVTSVVSGLMGYQLFRFFRKNQIDRMRGCLNTNAISLTSAFRYESEKMPGSPERAFTAALSQFLVLHSDCPSLVNSVQLILVKRNEKGISILNLNNNFSSFSHSEFILQKGSVPEFIKSAAESESGTFIGKNCNGEKILAAYMPVRDLNMSLVAQLGYSSIINPFIEAAEISGIVGIILVLVGCFVFFRLGKGVLNELNLKNLELKKANELFSFAVEGTSDGLWDWPDIDKDENWWSKRIYELIGYNETDLESRFSTFEKILHPDDMPQLKKTIEAHIKSKGAVPYDIEFRLMTKAGKYKWFRARAKAYFNSGGPIKMSGSIQDIDRTVHLREELKTRIIELDRAESFTRLILDSISHSLYVIDAKTYAVTLANRKAEKLYGKNLKGRKCYEVTHRSKIPCGQDKKKYESHFCPMKDVVSSGKAVTVQHIHVDTAGRRRYIEISASPVKDKVGNITSIVEYSFDITDRVVAFNRQKLYLEILSMLNSERSHKAMIEAILKKMKGFTEAQAVGIRLKSGDDYPYFLSEGFDSEFLERENFICSRDGKCDSNGNVLLEGMCGIVIRGNTDSGKPFFTEGGSFWTNSTTELLLQKNEEESGFRTRNTCSSSGYESVALIPIKSGRKIVGLIQFNDRRTNRFTIDFIEFFEKLGNSIGISISRDLLKKDLSVTENLYKELFDNIRDGAAVYEAVDNGKDFIIRDINKAGEKSENIKKEDIIGRYLTEVFPSVEKFGLLELLRKVYREGGSKYLPPTFYSDGRIEGWRENFIYRLPSSEVAVVYKDLTEKIKMEERVRQSEKMEAIGQLAGGVAHDFNNILTVIVGNAELVSTYLDKTGDFKAKNLLPDLIKEIIVSSQRASDLTKQLLIFSRKDTYKIEELNVNETVNGLINMFSRILPEYVLLDTVLYDGLLAVLAGKSQIEQIILNIVINARDAMPSGGTITLKTYLQQTGENFKKEHMIETEGPFAVISISDTGEGMDKTTQKHIFEPFFTTKPEGKGTGMGLATVYGIVKKLKGAITVYSEQGKGTFFKVYLPVLEGKTTKLSEKKIKSNIQLPKGCRILLAEDNPQILKIAEAVLTNAGCTVLKAFNGTEALKRAAEADYKIDLLFTDVIMPDINGRELYEKLTAMMPELKVLFTSGYAAEHILKEDLIDNNIGFLDKPYSPEDLLIAVKQLVNSA